VWSVVTVTTVGYGDLYPKTVQGRRIGILPMFVGIGFLSLLTAAMASRFVRQDAEVELVDVMKAPADRGSRGGTEGDGFASRFDLLSGLDHVGRACASFAPVGASAER
jgi:voltage-gated potassium channel Kch